MKERILSLVSPEYPWKDRFCYLEETGSTNDDLKRLARQGAPHGTAIVAECQTVGHGRLGRSFHSPKGMGIYLSILLRPQFRGTGYDANQRTQGDFGSDIYIIEKITP